MTWKKYSEWQSLSLIFQLGEDLEYYKLVSETVIVVQLIIEFVKMIPGFRDLPESDQVHLLKRTTSDLMILRTAYR